MFRIKICGVTRPEDAELVGQAGADALGINFYARSPRYVAPETAAGVAGAVPPSVARVGVFVNPDVDEACRLFDALSLDFVQLHGDETPETLGQFGRRPIIKAFRCRDDGLSPVARYMKKCRSLGVVPAAVLIDAHVPGQYGGTGTIVDWNALADLQGAIEGVPIVLAGGLSPRNVADAIAVARPRAVDVASGVESAAGIKNAELVHEFVARAKEAFEQN